MMLKGAGSRYSYNGQTFPKQITALSVTRNFQYGCPPHIIVHFIKAFGDMCVHMWSILVNIAYSFF